MPFTIEIAGDPDQLTLRLHGLLDTEGGETLLRAVQAAVVSARKLTVDLRALEGFTPSGAAALSRCGRRQPRLRYITGPGVGRAALLAALGPRPDPVSSDAPSSSV